MLVPEIEAVGTQRRVQMVHQRNVGRIVKGGALRDHSQIEQDAFGVLMALLGQEHLARLLVEREIPGRDNAFASAGIGLAVLLGQQRHHLVHGDVHLGVVFGLAADNQGRARLVDQDRIHFVDDREVEPALDPVGHLVDHVVAQVVEAEFVVGAVRDVTPIGRLLGSALHVRQVDADAQAEEAIELAHPLCIAVRQIVVDSDHVHAASGQGIEIHRQGGGERLAFTGAHLGDLAVVQRHAAQHLDVEVPHLHDPLGAFAHHRESFGQHIVQRHSGGDTALELVSLAAQLSVAELLETGLQRGDPFNGLAELLEQAVVAAAENLSQEVGCHERDTALLTHRGPQSQRNPLLCRMK